MTGSGTAENPYIVEGEADFRELDGKSGYIVICADINFNASGGRESFDGVSLGGEVFIDGGGHTISNFYQELTSVYPNGGLFSGTFTGVLKNLNIENAYILGTSSLSGVSGSAGVIAPKCGKCYISGVNITGAVNISSSNETVGGFFGENESLDGTGYMNEYDITIEYSKSNINIYNQYFSGGFIGSAKEGNYIFNYDVAACKIFRNGSRASGYVAHANTGKHIATYLNCVSQCDIESVSDGSMAHGFYSGYDYGKRYFTNCASICTMKCTYDSTISRASGFGEAASIFQCYSICTFDNYYKSYGLSGSCSRIAQSYAVCSVTNPETGEHYGITGSGTVKNSFFDITALPSAQDAERGATTEQLKNAEWLRGQGWAI